MMVRRNGQVRHRLLRHPEPRDRSLQPIPSTCALPFCGRWSLRRRAPVLRSAEEVEQCEPAAAGHRVRVLRRPPHPRAATRGEPRNGLATRASALVRHLSRRMRSDGLETVNVRTSRGTTVPVATAYYREKHARSGDAAGRDSTPTLVVMGIYDRCTPKLASDASRAVAMLSSLARSAGATRRPRASPWISRPSARPPIATLRGPVRPSRARRAVCSTAMTGKRVVLSSQRKPRQCEAQEAWPQDEEGAQPIAYRLEGNQKLLASCKLRRQGRATDSDVGPGSGCRSRSEDAQVVFALLVVVRREHDRPQRR